MFGSHRVLDEVQSKAIDNWRPCEAKRAYRAYNTILNGTVLHNSA